MPWSESSQDLAYYREFLNDLTGPRVYTPPTIVNHIYLESAQDLLYYRAFLARI